MIHWIPSTERPKESKSLKMSKGAKFTTKCGLYISVIKRYTNTYLIYLFTSLTLPLCPYVMHKIQLEIRHSTPKLD